MPVAKFEESAGQFVVVDKAAGVDGKVIILVSDNDRCAYVKLTLEATRKLSHKLLELTGQRRKKGQ